MLRVKKLTRGTIMKWHVWKNFKKNSKNSKKP